MTQATLFDLGRPEDQHDPGGKVRLKLPSGMSGIARFSRCGRYRTWLRREWGEPARNPTGVEADFALWIGMNPSTAGADVNDPTVAKEIGFTWRLWGLRGYVKTNVMDWRATSPDALIEPGVVPRSDGNLAMIREFASRAAVVVLAFGKLHPRLAHYGEETIAALRADGRELWCLGRNGDGSPKHPLYLANATQVERF